jgi:hypothetical protein
LGGGASVGLECLVFAGILASAYSIALFLICSFDLFSISFKTTVEAFERKESHHNVSSTLEELPQPWKKFYTITPSISRDLKSAFPPPCVLPFKGFS